MDNHRLAHVFDSLSPEAEDAIIEIFKENPCLYDIADSRYKNRERKCDVSGFASSMFHKCFKQAKSRILRLGSKLLAKLFSTNSK